MKSKVLSLILVICMLLSFASVNVFAADTDAVLFTGIFDGDVTANTDFKRANGGDYSVESNGIGGKAAGDAYIKLDTSSFASGDMRMYITNGTERFTRNYFIFTLGIYGNKSSVSVYNRIDGSTKPKFPAVAASKFDADKWNRIMYVYEVATEKVSAYVNGAYLGEADFSTVANLTRLNDIRFNFDKNGVIYLDDIAVFGADTIPQDYMPSLKNENITVFEETSTVMFSGDTFEIESDDTVRVSKDNGVTWIDSNVVQTGNFIALERNTVFGSMYKYYYAFTSTGFKNVLATKDGGAAYVQGGSPQDAEGNAIANTKVDVVNPHGSGATMELMAAGVNASNSTQTYYQYEWPNAKNSASPNYLVVEANFAFPTKTETLYPVSGIGLSTNGGVPIGTGASYERLDLQNRINHYMWVYDKVNGTYVDYLNGEALVSEPVEVVADFKEGTKKAIRLTANGTYIKDGSCKDRLYAAYLSDYVVYECYEYEVPQGLKIPGTNRSLLPYVGATVKTSELLNLFAEEDRQYVTIYANRGYTPITNPEQVLNTGSAIIMTNKDGIYDYARVSCAPSADADFAIDTIQAPSDNSVYAVIVNLKDTGEAKRPITFVLARYDESGNMTEVNFVNANMSLGGATSVKLLAAKSMGDVRLFAFNDFDSLTPVSNYMKIR